MHMWDIECSIGESAGREMLWLRRGAAVRTKELLQATQTRHQHRCGRSHAPGSSSYIYMNNTCHYLRCMHSSRQTRLSGATFCRITLASSHAPFCELPRLTITLQVLCLSAVIFMFCALCQGNSREEGRSPQCRRQRVMLRMQGVRAKRNATSKQN